jgi:DNA polymerase-3 subunit epsilon
MMMLVKGVLARPMAFVDIETTGGSHFTSRVLEVGVVRVENGQVTATYQTLLQPDEAIPEFITGLTGIRDQDVASAPRFASVASELAEILDGAIFVAHNVRFDYSFMKMEFDRLDVPFKPPMLCTVRLSRRLFPQFRTHKLADLIERHQLSAPSRHRAYDDAHCLWQFFGLCLAQFDLDELEAAINAQLKAPSIPSQLDPAQVDRLPEGPGVYIFEDEDGSPLYVGKSVGVKRRVLSHFASDYERGVEHKLAGRVKTLKGIPTHGELSALLLESEMVKDMKPMYNRMLRNRSPVTLVLDGLTAEGYATVTIRDTDEILAEDVEHLLAVYSTPGRTKQSLEATCWDFRLCPKLMGLEQTSRRCFAAQLGKCMGACAGEEDVASYNGRFKMAFGRQRIAAWPYRGPILIQERHEALDGASGYIIDRWCLVASLRELPDGSAEQLAGPQPFDLDRYRIIRRYVETASNRGHITPLSDRQAEQLLAGAVRYN